MSEPTLDPRAQFAGRSFVVFGGTGFLGKVWVSMLLRHYPDVEHIYLVVRKRRDQSSEERFWAEIASSGAFDPVRESLTDESWDDFVRRKITPLHGDVTDPFGGVSEELRDRMRGKVHALVNVSGVVDFNPPLDYALKVNAYGARSLVNLARDLGDIPFLHTSTCYVAGDRTGAVGEVDPRDHPFPKADELDPKHWDPQQEIAECEDVIEHTRHRLNDAFRQSLFLDQAKKNLRERGEPSRGSALEDELANVKRKFESEQLIEAGLERAHFWGWHNTYTYTKSIGEQVVAGSGLRFTITRPAVIESAFAYPKEGWNEGINTSAPIIYLALKGVQRFAGGKDSVLDIIPVDMVAAGMLLALAELLEDTHQPVYQFGTSDSNPCSIYRLIELVGLYKRRSLKRSGKGNPLVNWLQIHSTPVPISSSEYFRSGPTAIAEKVEGASRFLKRLGKEVLAVKPLMEPAAEALDGFAVTSRRTAFILDQFVPFMATHSYRFDCGNTRRAWARVSAEDQERLCWAPDRIDWRHYFLEVHVPGLEEHVWPQIEAKIDRPTRPLRRHDELVSFLDEVAERHVHAPALMRTHPDGFTRLSYRDLRERARAAACRLVDLGVQKGDRVFLSGQNHPDWVVTWFAVQLAGAVVVPVDPALTEAQVANISAAASVKVSVVDPKARDSFGAVLLGHIADLHDLCAEGPTENLPSHAPDSDDVASILFTSGTTGVPKGVMLTHGNICSLLAAIGKLFDLNQDDRILSVLPLHHTFEFACGLLLPLSRGARIIYLDELTGERLAKGLADGRVTGMVGVPALWQLLERRISAQVSERGALFETAFDLGLDLNRVIGKATGLDVGKLFFGQVHQRLGGNIRFLISGGSALPKDIHRFFSGLGLHMAEGYGLTEASPVLTVAKAGPGRRPGTVGKAIPGVELMIHEPDSEGVGEILARGPNVMKGYYGNTEATSAVLDDDGWLHTGDLGRIDHKKRLFIVGRAKDVVVTSAGENIYLDDVEEQLGRLDYVKEYALVGLEDPRGGERLGMLAVPEEPGELDRHSTHARALSTIREKVAKLSPVNRPAVIRLVDADLPRTATRKVKRNDVKKVLERIAAASAPIKGADRAVGPVRVAVARVAGVELAKVDANTNLPGDLGFDSLMWVELASALEGVKGSRPDAEALQRCETISEVEALVSAPAPEIVREPDVRDTVRIPAPLVQPLRTALTAAQRETYGRLLEAKVTGRAYIPYNRPTIVVSNHSSHLDMGLVKYALGSYGVKVVALAAKDYFFEGNKWLVAYFEQLTNLQPIDRSKGFRASFEQAKAVVDGGEVVLIFPEGTRRTDGTLGPFKPLVGKLALETGVDVLPLFVEGTFDVLPKGAVLPRGRSVTVRIGPPLSTERMQALTDGMRASEAARHVTGIIRKAVVALKEHEVLDLDRATAAELEIPQAEPEDPLADLFGELERRFQPQVPEKPVCWYFSLGTDPGGKWTVGVGPGTLDVRRGRPAGAADCVIKTSAGLWTRMVREGYVPDPAEFVAGNIKTSDLELLMAFGQVFKLGPLEEARS